MYLGLAYNILTPAKAISKASYQVKNGLAAAERVFEVLETENTITNKENAVFSGRDKIFWLTTDFMKEKGIKKIKGYMFRYVYPLNKEAKKIMKNNSTLNWTLDYPKDKDLCWKDSTDSKNQIDIEQPAFTFETAKYNLKNIESHKKQTPSLEGFFNNEYS